MHEHLLLPLKLIIYFLPSAKLDNFKNTMGIHVLGCIIHHLYRTLDGNACCMDVWNILPRLPSFSLVCKYINIDHNLSSYSYLLPVIMSTVIYVLI